MITGACKAAIHDKIKFSKINGYGSKPLLSSKKTLEAIQMVMNMKNEIINVQLPPNDATLSAITCPNVLLSTSSSILFTKDFSPESDFKTFLCKSFNSPTSVCRNLEIYFSR